MDYLEKATQYSSFSPQWHEFQDEQFMPWGKGRVSPTLYAPESKGAKPVGSAGIAGITLLGTFEVIVGVVVIAALAYGGWRLYKYIESR